MIQSYLLSSGAFKKLSGCLVMAALLLCCSGARAADVNAREAANDWSILTRLDLSAAYRLINDNHPGAAASLHDPDFKRRLREGYAKARARAQHVDSLAGYRATLRGFANAFGDEHIWANVLYRPALYRWAGLIVSKSGQSWTVAITGPEEEAFKGSELLGCDGKSAENLGRDRLGAFQADWSVPAQQVKQAPWLLIDSGNPFLPQLNACELRTGKGIIKLNLNWRDIRPSDLDQKTSMAIATGKAGYGVRKFAGGTWISLEGLQDKAPAVIAEVRSNLQPIRESRLVVVDVRGNGGGASEYGDQLARLLLSDSYVSSIMSSASGANCLDVWRVSSGNVGTMRNYKTSLGPTLGLAFVRQMDELLAASKRAVRAGMQFTGPIQCKSKVPAAATAPPPWPAHFKLVFLTDADCFSSCLLMAGEFRMLGAVQVGQPTDAATRYMEVREVLLPSKLTKFSTLQSFNPGMPPRVGPFEPGTTYNGDIADTAALQTWIRSRF